MPAQALDQFGDNPVISWADGAVRQSLNGGPPQAILALAQESGLAIAALPDGRWVVALQAADAGVQRSYSDDGVHYA